MFTSDPSAESNPFADALAGSLELVPSGPEFVEPPPPPPPVYERPQLPDDWLYNELRDVYSMDLEVQPHQKLCAQIQAACGDFSFKGEKKTVILLGVPRTSYKTTICAQGLPCVAATQNHNVRVLIDSFRHDVSKKRLRAVRRHFESNTKLHDRYGDNWKPEARTDTWSDDAIVVAERDDLSLIDPTVATAGTDRSMVGGHFNLIIADDLVNDRNSRFKEQRDVVYDHIVDLMPLLEPGGVLIIIFTRWHVDDAYGRIIKEEAERARNGEESLYQIIVHSAYNPDGSLFFPGKLTHAFLDAERARMGSRKFAAQYLLQPMSDEDKTFNMDRARLVNFTFEPSSVWGVGTIHIPQWAGEKRPVEVSATWDPAGRKGSRTSDFHGMTVVGCDPTDTWFVLEAEEMKASPSTIIDTWCKLIAYYKPRALSCESVGEQAAYWLGELGRELDRRGITRPAFVEQSTNNMSKATRIELLQPRWERGGMILLPKQAKLLEQIDDFTLGAEMEHEDVLDALQQQMNVARPASADFKRSVENPIDPEWVARERRVKQENRAGGSMGGMHGSTWQTLR